MPERKLLPDLSPEWHYKFDQIAKKHNVNKYELAKWMISESNLSQNANSSTSTAQGIFQLLKSTAATIGVDYDVYKKQTAYQQLDALDKYLSYPDIAKYIGPDTKFEDFKVLGFASSMGPHLKDDNFVVYKPDSEAVKQNPGIDISTIGAQKKVARQIAIQKAKYFAEFEAQAKEKLTNYTPKETPETKTTQPTATPKTITPMPTPKQKILPEGFQTEDAQKKALNTLMGQARIYKETILKKRTELKSEIDKLKTKSAITIEEAKTLQIYESRMPQLSYSAGQANAIANDINIDKLPYEQIQKLTSEYYTTNKGWVEIDKLSGEDRLNSILKNSIVNTPLINEAATNVGVYLIANPKLTVDQAQQKLGYAEKTPAPATTTPTTTEPTTTTNTGPYAIDPVLPYDKDAYQTWLKNNPRYSNARPGSIQEQEAKIAYAATLKQSDNIDEYRNFVAGENLEPAIKELIGIKYLDKDLNDPLVKNEYEREVAIALQPHLADKLNTKFDQEKIRLSNLSGESNVPNIGDLPEMKPGKIDWGNLLPETKANLGLAALQTVAGIGSMANAENDHGRPDYQRDPTLQTITDASVAKAFGGGDDYASRIRAKNAYETNAEQAVNLSGGSRGAAITNINAATDVLNNANLGIDMAFAGKKTADMNTAMGFVNANNQDRMSEFNDRYTQWQEKNQRKFAGSQLIQNAMLGVNNSLAHETQYGHEGTMANYIKFMAELQKKELGYKPQPVDSPKELAISGAFSPIPTKQELPVNVQSVDNGTPIDLTTPKKKSIFDWPSNLSDLKF